jgi:hypothetical protein
VVRCDENHTQTEVKEQLDYPKKSGKPLSWRKDVVYKTILRKIRKEYLNEFNTRTKYILTKRSRKPTYLLEKLEEYADFLLDGKNSDLTDELVFFMGCIFYPKHMKNIYSTAQKLQEIETVHSSLYSFTKKKLSNLESYGAYHFLINLFQTKHRDSLFKKDDSQGNAICNEESFQGEEVTV